MKIKKLFLVMCFAFLTTTLVAQSKKINQDFIGYWSLEGFQSKMVIFQRNDTTDIVFIDWAYCKELETLEVIVISENELLVSLKNPDNDWTTVSRVKIINRNRLEKKNQGSSNATTYWNRIK